MNIFSLAGYCTPNTLKKSISVLDYSMLQYYNGDHPMRRGMASLEPYQKEAST